MADIERQLPVGEEIFLDHVGHFVRDPNSASSALIRAGFAPTAVSVQVSPDATGRPLPTGTGNVTAMFRRGYMEVLFKTADTPLGLEFAASLKAFSGLHLAAFSVADAQPARCLGLRHAAARLFRAAGLDRDRLRQGGLHRDPRRARRHGRGPHPDS